MGCCLPLDGEAIKSRLCRPTNVDPRKSFVAGRTRKFSLNLKGTCDAEKKFLEISITHILTQPLTSWQLKVQGFLAPGLYIFGDSAYANKWYCVTSFKDVKSGVQYSFNFYQS
jgi:hypothetical protein